MIAPALALVLLLAGCAAGPEISWDERVQASTGEVFTVKRREIRRYVAEPLQEGGWLFMESRIEGEIPGRGAFRWDTSLKPWLLDRAKDGRWYFIAMMGGSGESEYGLGVYRGTAVPPRFVFYREQPGDWERILVNDLPPEFKTPNLLLNGTTIFEPRGDDRYWRAKPAPSRRFWNGDLLSLEMKRHVNVPYHRDLNWMFNLDLAPKSFLDHGNRQWSECLTGGRCDQECWKAAPKGQLACKSVERFEVGQFLGRPPRSVAGAK